MSPIASGRDYAADVERAKAFEPLIEAGYANNLVEAAIRFAISKAEISTALVGVSSLEQLKQAVEYASRGPLPVDTIGRHMRFGQALLSNDVAGTWHPH